MEVRYLSTLQVRFGIGINVDLGRSNRLVNVLRQVCITQLTSIE